MTLQLSPAESASGVATGGRLQIQPVATKHDREQFIRMPWRLYQHDRFWVPPLLYDRRQLLSPKNPFFEHARMNSWIAFRGSQPVGRISAQIDQLHLDSVDPATGFFGMLEAEDDPAVFDLLFSAAESWLRENGMQQIIGPFNLSINHDCGLLVDGFESPPYFMMPHNPPYYEKRIEERGYRPIKDTLAYLMDIDAEPTPAIKAVARRNADAIHVRPLDFSRLPEELETLRDIHQDAWADNWNFVPFTNEEFTHLGRDLKSLVPPDMVQIAEIEGEPAAMVVGFPNINEAIADLNGRLFPLGWLKLLWRLKVSFTRTARVPLMGIRRKYHHTLMGASLALMVINQARAAGKKRGIEQIELSWILDDNQGMRNIIESLGATVHKRYRFFAGDIGGPPQ
jgi:hypothetical protein